jgi:hypothetical protein
MRLTARVFVFEQDVLHSDFFPTASAGSNFFSVVS